MIRMLASIRRRPGMALSEYFRYIVDVHGKIARDNPLTLRRYHQLHVSDGCYGQKGDKGHSLAFSRDSVTELWFDDMEALGRCFTDPYTKNVTGPDGANFSDLSSPITLIVGEEVSYGNIEAGERTKLLWFLKAREGISEAGFAAAWTKADARASGTAGVKGRTIAPALRSKEAREVLGYFGSAGPVNYDGVLSLWIEAIDPVVFIRKYEAAFLEGSEDWIDRSQSFWLIGHEHVVLDLTRAAYAHSSQT